MTAEDIHWDYTAEWKREREAIDARVRNDVQELVIRLEEILTGWAADDLLDRSISSARWDDETRQFQQRRMVRSKAEAVQWHVAVIRDMILDARSLTAIEAEEVARGDQ